MKDMRSVFKAAGGRILRQPNHNPVTTLHACIETDIRGFPKIGGTLFWGPYNKDPAF